MPSERFARSSTRTRPRSWALFVQDETEPVDTVQAMQDAGLDRFAFTHAADDPRPTVSELIVAATPLVVLAENQSTRSIGRSHHHPGIVPSVTAIVVVDVWPERVTSTLTVAPG
jgi:hypothetical protein